MTTERELVTVAMSPEPDKNDVGVLESSEVLGGGWVNEDVAVLDGIWDEEVSLKGGIEEDMALLGGGSVPEGIKVDPPLVVHQNSSKSYWVSSRDRAGR
jgi:hypothetical protein